MIRVAVSGLGQMGRIVVDAVEATEDMQLVGIVKPRHEGAEFKMATGVVYETHADPVSMFQAAHPDVVVDFTNAEYTPTLLEAAFACGVRPVVGTSGIGGTTLEALREGCARQQLGGVLAPNFALGAIVLMHLSTIAAK